MLYLTKTDNTDHKTYRGHESKVAYMSFENIHGTFGYGWVQHCVIKPMIENCIDSVLVMGKQIFRTFAEIADVITSNTTSQTATTQEMCNTNILN